MRRSENQPRADALRLATEKAALGDTHPLHDYLCRGSRLPGEFPNVALAVLFAHECARLGKPGDRVAVGLSVLTADEAPGASVREFLPLCGVLGLGACAAKEPRVRRHHAQLLYELADDFRYRVRDVVPQALAWIGAAAGSEFLNDLREWRSGFFHAAALLTALSSKEWLPKFNDSVPLTDVLEESFALLRDASRSTSRYPGYKALFEALPKATNEIARRFGAPVLAVVSGWTQVKEPALRELVDELASAWPKRFADEVAQVRAGLKSSAPKPRDPTLIRPGMRGRSKKRARK